MNQQRNEPACQTGCKVADLQKERMDRPRQSSKFELIKKESKERRRKLKKEGSSASECSCGPIACPGYDFPRVHIGAGRCSGWNDGGAKTTAWAKSRPGISGAARQDGGVSETEVDESARRRSS